MKELNILFLSEHCCIRVIKEGLALLKAGVNIHFCQKRFQNVEFRKIMPQASFWEMQEDLYEKIRGMEGFDLIHVHNEPSWIATVAKQARPDIPVILDCHDLNSARFGKHNEIEDAAIKTCDGFITPSYGYKQHIKKFYKCCKPVEVIYSMCNEDFYFDRQPNRVPSVPGVVYEGGITADDRHPHPYRDYRQLTNVLLELGIPFHIYGANDTWNATYQHLGAYMYPTLPYNEMLRSLSRYDWGFVGPGVPHRAFDWCMPNKLFEYLAAGIPVIVWKSDEAAEWVKERGVGVVIDDLNEIGVLADFHAGYKEKVRAMRFTMENQIDKLINFYNQLL